MRMHHMDGTPMAEHELRNGRNEEIKRVVRRILESQEVDHFERVVAGKGQPVSRKPGSPRGAAAFSQRDRDVSLSACPLPTISRRSAQT